MLNLTPHSITVGSVTLPPSGTIARVTTTEVVVGTCPITGVEIVARQFGEVTGLPVDGQPCIVSALVLSACAGMPGVFAPDTGATAIRNDAGQIVAVTRLVRS